MKRWLVKIARNGGGTSVITDYDEYEDARLHAEVENNWIQSDNYYVEENWNS